MLYDESYNELVDVDNGSRGEDEGFVYTLPSSGIYYLLCAYHYAIPTKIQKNMKTKTRSMIGNYILEVVVQNPPICNITPKSISIIIDTGMTANDTVVVENTSERDLVYFASHCVDYFEVDSAGYNHDGVNDLWDWGIPDYSWQRPAHSGEKVWGINLPGVNLTYADCYLQSTAIDLSGTTNPQLKFWHWFYDFHPYYGRNVKVSVDGEDNGELIFPDGGYPADSIASGCALYPEPGYVGITPEWQSATFDLSDYVGDTILIRWCFGSSIYYVFSASWFIDDVEITDLPENSWLTLNGGSCIGDTLSTGSDDVVIGVNSVNLDPAVYTKNIIFAYNTEDSPDTVNITMTVLGGQISPPDSISIKIIADGDSIKISWHNEGLIYRIYCNDVPDENFPEEWTAIDTLTNGNEITIPFPPNNKMFYLLTADNPKYMTPAIKEKKSF